jgi:hypothetical protein
MIPTIGDYLYLLEFRRNDLLIQAERRKAAWLLSIFVAGVSISAFLWIIYI